MTFGTSTKKILIKGEINKAMNKKLQGNQQLFFFGNINKINKLMSSLTKKHVTSPKLISNKK